MAMASDNFAQGYKDVDMKGLFREMFEDEFLRQDGDSDREQNPMGTARQASVRGRGPDAGRGGDGSHDPSPTDDTVHDEGEQATPPPDTARPVSKKTELVMELRALADDFDGKHSAQMEEDLDMADAYQSIQDFNYIPGGRVDEEIIMNVIAPIVGHAAGHLTNTICGFAVTRRLIKRCKDTVFLDDRESFLQRAAGLMDCLFQRVVLPQEPPMLRFSRNQLLSALPQAEQVKIISSLSTRNATGIEVWKVIASTQFDEQRGPFTECHQVWFVLTEDMKYTVGMLYNTLISLRQLRAAMCLAAS